MISNEDKHTFSRKKRHYVQSKGRVSISLSNDNISLPNDLTCFENTHHKGCIKPSGKLINTV